MSSRPAAGLWIGGVALVLALAVGCDKDRSTETTAPPAAPATGQTRLQLTSVEIPVEGMTCASCEFAIKKAVGKLDGVVSCDASTEQAKAVVRYDAATISAERIAAAITDLGYQAHLPQPPNRGDETPKEEGL